MVKKTTNGQGMKAHGARKPMGGAAVTSKSSPDSGKPSQQYSATGGVPHGTKPAPDSGRPREAMNGS